MLGWFQNNVNLLEKKVWQLYHRLLQHYSENLSIAKPQIPYTASHLFTLISVGKRARNGDFHNTFFHINPASW